MSWNSITLISIAALALVLFAMTSEGVGGTELAIAGLIVLLLWGAQMFGNLFRDNDRDNEPL
jgi:hypothetical protein